jgi:hypothetical protein
MERLVQTVDQLLEAVAGAPAASLARRPAADAWAPIEVLGHLRDSEEWFLTRCRWALAMNEPAFPKNNPECWANERQYLRHDAGQTIAAFARFRNEMLALFRGLVPEQWSRGGVHLDGRGRRTIDEFLTVMAWHDDNHLDQLGRALAGAA